jgi:hypothetical protein
MEEHLPEEENIFHVQAPASAVRGVVAIIDTRFIPREKHFALPKADRCVEVQA